jgi:HSP20 family protein
MFNKIMEGLTMTLLKLSNKNLPGLSDWDTSLPSIFNRFFDGEWMDWRNSNFADVNSTLPAVNIQENENDYQIELAAPGLKKDDFKVNFDNGSLIISSEISDEKKTEDKKYSRREFNYQSFQRTFSIPKNLVNHEKISASYENGLLKITLPKAEEVKQKPVKQIKIS